MGRPKKFDPRYDWNGRRFPPHTKPKRQPGSVRRVWWAWRDGKRIAKQYTVKPVQERIMSTTYDPKKSVAAGGKQAVNTVGSGGVGAVVTGLIYSLLPETMDPEARTAIAGAAGVLVTVGTSYLWGWWRNRAKHIAN